MRPRDTMSTSSGSKGLGAGAVLSLSAGMIAAGLGLAILSTRIAEEAAGSAPALSRAVPTSTERLQQSFEQAAVSTPAAVRDEPAPAGPAAKGDVPPSDDPAGAPVATGSTVI